MLKRAVEKEKVKETKKKKLLELPNNNSNQFFSKSIITYDNLTDQIEKQIEDDIQCLYKIESDLIQNSSPYFIYFTERVNNYLSLKYKYECLLEDTQYEKIKKTLLFWAKYINKSQFNYIIMLFF